MTTRITAKTKQSAKSSEIPAEVSLKYSAVEAAKYWGTSDRSVAQSWTDKLTEIFWWRVEDLKEADSDRYTQFALEEFGKLQAAISPKVPVRNDDGLIIRDDSGKPKMEKNTNRIGFDVYKNQVWSEFNRFPEQRVDAPTEVLDGEVCDEFAMVPLEESMQSIDNLESFMDSSLSFIDEIGEVVGDRIVAQFSSAVTKRVDEGITDTLTGLKKSLDPRQRAKS